MKTLGWLVLFGFAATTGRVVTFDTSALGQTPSEWTVAMTNRGRAPHWEVVRDQTAPTQPYVFAQTAADRVGDRFPLAIQNGVPMRDGDVSVRLKPVSGHDVRAGGVVWHYRDQNNYYLARANAVDKNVQVFKAENGRLIPLISGAK